MPDSIREQILSAFDTRLSTILKSNQYNTDMGKNVYRSFLPPIDLKYAPCMGFHVDTTENESLYSYKEQNTLPLKVQGVVVFGSVEPWIMAERMFADISECVLGNEYTINFDSGGTHEPSGGDTILGETSAAESTLISKNIDSGAWVDGDADGSFVFRRLSGTYQNNEDLTIGGVVGVATVDGSTTAQGPSDLATGGLAEDITFVSGVPQMPDGDSEVVAVELVFNIRYKQISGNPYLQ